MQSCRAVLLFGPAALTVLGMAILKEITVKLANSPGSLGRVLQLFGGERINVLAMSIDPSGHLRTVVDNPLHAAGTLREQHYNVEERDVLFTTMPNEPGALGRALGSSPGRAVRLVSDAASRRGAAAFLPAARPPRRTYRPP